MTGSILSFLLIISLLPLNRQAQEPFPVWPELSGPYLGQKPPGKVPEIFARGIVSTDMYNHSSVAISPDGREIYWAMAPLDHPLRIYVSKWRPEGWSRPEIVSFTKEDNGDCPVLSPDGRRIYFNSNRSISAGGPQRERYWVSEREGEGWSEPLPLGPHINREHLHWQGSVDSRGNFYFGSAREGALGRDDVFVAPVRMEEGSEAIRLDAPVNSDRLEGCPFISPDGSYLIFDRDGLVVSFRQADGRWGTPLSLGLEGTCPFVSPDGKYVFFLKMGMGYNDVYWVDASVLNSLKPPV